MSEEARAILIKYHAEGDPSSEFVSAEMAQIDATLKIEFEASRRSWMDLLGTAGMRRRALITSFLGLFTQWSGNTLISYYLGDLLEMIGWSDSVVKQKVNLVNACWSLVGAFLVALVVRRFKRRTMYLTCAAALLTVYICWTVSMERAVTARDAGGENKAAGWAVIVFIFLYSPAYNIGYNALTYSKQPDTVVFYSLLTMNSLSCRVVALRRTKSRNRSVPAFRAHGWLLYHLCQPNWP